jgi:hypothetical protein
LRQGEANVHAAGLRRTPPADGRCALSRRRKHGGPDQATKKTWLAAAISKAAAVGVDIEVDTDTVPPGWSMTTALLKPDLVVTAAALERDAVFRWNRL